MRIVKNSEIESVIEELKGIKSNEKGKLISPDLLDIKELPDWRERNLFLSGNNLENGFLKEFAEYFKGIGKVLCLIVFSKNADIDFVLRAMNLGILRENMLLVGAGNLSVKEIEFLAKTRIKNISLNSFLVDIEDTVDSIMEFASGKELFLVFDVSVLDCFEAGGLSLRQAIYSVGRMSMMKNLQAVLISGVNKESAKIVAKLLAELV